MKTYDVYRHDMVGERWIYSVQSNDPVSAIKAALTDTIDKGRPLVRQNVWDTFYEAREVPSASNEASKYIVGLAAGVLNCFLPPK